MALVTTLLPTVARRGGLEPLGLAALAAAPFIANLLGVFAGRFGPRSPRQLALIRGAGAASLIALFIVPTPSVMVVASIVFWLSLSFGGPFHLRLWGAMYPARLRGRIVGMLGTGRAAAGALAAFAGGVLADQLGGPTAVAVGGLDRGRLRRRHTSGLRAQAAGDLPRFSARESIRALRERPVLGRVALAQGFYGGGLIAALPLYALVYVDRLDLSLSDVGIIGILDRGRDDGLVPRLGHRRRPVRRDGRDADRQRDRARGAARRTPSPRTSRCSGSAAVAAGAASASIDVGIAAVGQRPHDDVARAPPAMAGWNAITGARGIVAAFLMSALLQAGLVDVTTGLLLCAASSAIGVALYVRTGTDAEAATSPVMPARVARAATGLRAAVSR